MTVSALSTCKHKLITSHIGCTLGLGTPKNLFKNLLTTVIVDVADSGSGVWCVRVGGSIDLVSLATLTQAGSKNMCQMSD